MIPQNSVHVHKVIFLGLVAFCLLLFGTLLIQTTASAQMNDKKVAPKVGDHAPDCSLQDFKGNKFTLSKLTKKNGVLLWFTNLCEGCQSKIYEVQRLESRYEKKGIDVVAVSVLGEDRKTVEDVVRKNEVTFWFLYDPKSEATKRYSGKYIQGTCPLKNIFVIQRRGKITYAGHLPGADPPALEKELNNITGGIEK